MTDVNETVLAHQAIQLRYDVRAEDVAAVQGIVSSTDMFRTAEIQIAVELVEERLAKNAAAGYEFIFADQGSETIGYACYGSIACTEGSWDLYWIAVHADQQQRGVGKLLLADVERFVKQRSARTLYIDTSSQLKYTSTREFYRRCGYQQVATLRDFYAPGDDKVIFAKSL